MFLSLKQGYYIPLLIFIRFNSTKIYQMRCFIFIVLAGLLTSCTTRKDKDIKEAGVMISYYKSLISYEEKVNTMPYEYIKSLNDSLEMWYDRRYKLIVEE